MVNITYGDDINGVVNPDGTPSSSVDRLPEPDTTATKRKRPASGSY